MLFLLNAIRVQLTRVADVAEANLALVRCDRRTHGDPSGPPAFLGPCACSADSVPPSVAYEGEEFEGCCIQFGTATEEANIGPPDCFAFIPDTAVDPDDVEGAPEGLTLVKTDPNPTPGFAGECPSVGQVCLAGTPAADTGSLGGTVYRFKIKGTNCFGSDEIACSLIVKKREQPC